MSTKALLIEEDPAMSRFLGDLFFQNGMVVFSTNQIKTGIEMAREKQPDIVILDLLFTDSEDWEVCKSIRTNTQAPILVLSSLDDPSHISKALDAGADEYITKPVFNNVLIAHISNLTRRYAVENSLSNRLCSGNSLKIPANHTDF